MPKTLISIRISDHTKRQLNDLTERMGTTQTDAVAIAIDRMHQQEVNQQKVTNSPR